MTCSRTARHLGAYVDNELSVEQRIAVDAHLVGCSACTRLVDEEREMSTLVRQTGTRWGDGVPDAVMLDRVRASTEFVLSRVAAEREVARTSGLRRLAEEMHLVWLATAAGVVTAVCALVATAVVGAAGVQSPYSLAATMVAMANPGSNANPLGLRAGMAAPKLSQINQDATFLTLSDPMPLPGRPTGMTLSVVVTREGTVASLAVLGAQGVDPSVWVSLVDSAATARFAPAEYAGAPVAVNMVWVVEQVTIRGDATSEFPVSAPMRRLLPPPAV